MDDTDREAIQHAVSETMRAEAAAAASAMGNAGPVQKDFFIPESSDVLMKVLLAVLSALLALVGGLVCAGIIGLIVMSKNGAGTDATTQTKLDTIEQQVTRLVDKVDTWDDRLEQKTADRVYRNEWEDSVTRAQKRMETLEKRMGENEDDIDTTQESMRQIQREQIRREPLLNKPSY